MVSNRKYFISVTIEGERIEREVSLEEYCLEERVAGFYPKLCSDDPRYLKTPATSGFSSYMGLSGRIMYVSDRETCK